MRVAGEGPLKRFNDRATPLRAHPQTMEAPIPQHVGQHVGHDHTVPCAPAGCVSPMTGGEGPPGARPHAMHASSACSPRAGARHGTSQPLHALPVPNASSACGPPMAVPNTCQQRDPDQFMLRLREQHFMPFMQFHAQQGVPEHAARRMWDEYERCQLSAYMSQVA